MAQMASGAQFIKGNFTTDTSSTHTISFGRTLSKYLYYIEMTDDSKAALHNSGQTSAKMYACLGMYPANGFNGSSAPNWYMSYRANPSTNEISSSSTAVASAISNSSITLGLNAITGGANSLYRGYSYNYYIVEIK